MNEVFDRLNAKFESLGESRARIRLSQPRSFPPGHKGQIEEWLRLKELGRQDEELKRREARESEAISVAKEANRLAAEANRLALYAIITAVLAVIITIKDEVLKIIF